MHSLEKRIAQAQNQHGLALIPFITANFPNEEKFWDTLAELDSEGADIIEIGVPFSDPVADGPVVENASRKVLERGFSLSGLLKKLAQNLGKYKAGLVLMGYYNPFLQYGIEKLAEDAKNAGIEGVIIPDLPLDEAGFAKTILRRHGIALIPLVGPNTSAERMELYARDAEGYVYVVSVMGTTGARESLSAMITEVLKLAREKFIVPVALGFGLKNPAQLADIPASARPDAAVFGSALLASLEAGHSASEFMSVWK